MRSAVCSVIIPASNRLERFAVAVASARQQLAAGVEVLALDGGSSRGVSAWLSKRGEEWPSLRVVETAGLAPGPARNAAIEAARSPFIAFLDPACWWWPGKLAEQAGFHGANRDIAFSFTDYLQVLPSGESLGSAFAHWEPPLGRRHKSGYFPLAGVLQMALAANVIGTSTVMASKEALEKAGGFRDLPAACEWDLWLRLAAAGPVACSRAITATCPVQAEAAQALLQRIGAMEEILRPYESSRVATIRHAAAKGHAQLDCARAELSRPARRHPSAAQAGSRPITVSKRTKAADADAALDFAGAYGAGK
jgi:Glycosyl transferase family 2